MSRGLYEKTRKGFLKFKPSMVFYSYGKSLKFFSCGLSEKTHKGFISKLFKLSVYTYIILILINQWLLNLIFGMRKAMNVQNSSKQNFHPPPPLHFSMLFGTSCFNYCLVSSLFPPFFISNFINFFWPHSSWDYIASELIQHCQFQISANKPENANVMLT